MEKPSTTNNNSDPPSSPTTVHPTPHVTTSLAKSWKAGDREARSSTTRSSVPQFPSTPSPVVNANSCSCCVSFTTWYQLFLDGAHLSTTVSEKYSTLFLQNEMPPPTGEVNLFLDNEFLQSMGMEIAGHRGKILSACRQLGTSCTQPSRKVTNHQRVLSGSAPAIKEEGSSPHVEPRSQDSPVGGVPLNQMLRIYREGMNTEFDESEVEQQNDSTAQTQVRASAQQSSFESEGPSPINSTLVMDAKDLPGFRISDLPQQSLLPAHQVNVFEFVSNPEGMHRSRFNWIDVCGRDRDRTQYLRKLRELAQRFQFAESLLVDIDLTLALPQVISSPQEPLQFLVILRVATESTDIEEDSLHMLTNRWMIAVNLANHTIVTVHRVDSKPLAQLRYGWQNYFSKLTFSVFLCKVFDDSLVQYVEALQESEFLLDHYESMMLSSSVGMIHGNNRPAGGLLSSIFSNKKGASVLTDSSFGSLTSKSQKNLAPLLSLESGRGLSKQRMNQLLYHLHRRCSVYSRMLTLTQAGLETAYTDLNVCSPEYAEQMSRSCGELALKAETLHDNCQNLLNLHLSLVSFRTNELMSILTIFSAFFIPLTFIAGLYGMNFINMPELKFHNGYYYCLGAMGFITVVVFAFFKIKGLI